MSVWRLSMEEEAPPPPPPLPPTRAHAHTHTLGDTAAIHGSDSSVAGTGTQKNNYTANNEEIYRGGREVQEVEEKKKN